MFQCQNPKCKNIYKRSKLSKNDNLYYCCEKCRG